jgi:hypothetical protein
MTHQLTTDDLSRLTKERKYHEIEQARMDGRLDRVLGVPEEQIALLDNARSGTIDAADAAALNRLGRHDLVDAAREAGRITYPTQENAS